MRALLCCAGMLSALCPVVAWAEASGAPAPASEPLTLRYAPTVSAPLDYAVTWSLQIGVPLGATQTVEGTGRVALVALPAPKGEVLLQLGLVGFETRVQGEAFSPAVPGRGMRVRLDQHGRILEVLASDDADPFLGAILRVLFASTLPDKPATEGDRWAWPIPDGGEMVSGYEYSPPRVRVTHTSWVDRTAAAPPPPLPRGGVKQVLAARADWAGEPVVAVLSELPVDVDLSRMPLGTGGDALLTVQTERAVRTGEVRWARGTGNGRLRRVVLPSLPIEELTITLAQIDPVTRQPLEPLGSYEEPPQEEAPAS